MQFLTVVFSIGSITFLIFCQISTVSSAVMSPAQQLAFELTKSCYTDITKYRFDLFNTTKCSVSFTLICWPELEAGKEISIACPSMFYLPDRNVTRRCYANGTWETVSLKNNCNQLPADVAQRNFLALLAFYNITLPAAEAPVNSHLNRQIKIFVVMEWISLSVMIPSLVLLFLFPDLNDDKINLHRCLVFSFLMSVVTFLPEYYLSLSKTSPKACNALWIVNRFFAVSEVTWMFNEGIFLLKTIIFVFSQKSYIWAFFLFGWGFPAVLTLLTWTPVMVKKIGNFNGRCWTHEAQNNLMLILYVPMTIMLALNLIILVYVIGVVITKLKQNHSVDMQAKRKAAKGAIILMPLLGVIYLMIFYAPQGVVWYDYVLVIAQPIQGIMVCVAHVFFNKDVHSSMKNKWRKYKGQSAMFQSSKFYSGGGGTVAYKMKRKSTSEYQAETTLTSQSKQKRKQSSKVAPMANNNVFTAWNETAAEEKQKQNEVTGNGNLNENENVAERREDTKPHVRFSVNETSAENTPKEDTVDN